MYFAFLGYYTMFLGPPALFGLFCLLPIPSLFEAVPFVPLFSVFNLVWVTIFLESWKRNCAQLAYKWGTINSEPFEEARAAYYGRLAKNLVTGRLEPDYSKVKRLLIFYCISVPIVLFVLFLAFLIMLAYFWMEDIAHEYNRKAGTSYSEIILFLPTVIYVLAVIVMNAIYRPLAVKLNNWGKSKLIFCCVIMFD